MAYDYIVINEGTGGLNKRFKAIQMQPNIEMGRLIERTVGGQYDVSYGQNYESYSYLLRVPYAVTNSAYGTYQEFLQIARRNNPGATPPPTFTFTDQYGNQHTTSRFSGGQLAIELVSTIIDGSTNAASYLIKVTILLNPGDQLVPNPS